MPPKGIPLSPGETHVFSRPLFSYVDDLVVGRHEIELVFSDITFGSFEKRVHRVWVGEDGFSVMPEQDFPSTGPGAFPDEVQVYTLHSRYLEEQVVEVVASEDWILLNGQHGTIELVVPGLSDITGGRQEVAVSFDTSGLQGQGQYTGEVAFTTMNGSQTLHTEVRQIFLDFGREVYVGQPGQFTSPGTDLVEIGQIQLLAPPAPTLVDVDVELDLTYTQWQRGSGRIYLESPSGTMVGLFQAPFFSDQVELHVAVIYDDDSNPPSGPGWLADFAGQAIAGSWKILTDIEGSGTVDRVVLRVWH